MRETLFNWLGQDLGGCACLDLFAGSGVLGFEAASRGARRVTFVERDAGVFAALRRNADVLGDGRLELVREDAVKFVAFAAGQAKVGIRPIVDIYSTFLQRSYDQIFQEVALQNLPVTFLLDRAGLTGPDGPTHHGMFDLAYMRVFPNLVVMAPGDEVLGPRFVITDGLTAFVTETVLEGVVQSFAGGFGCGE
mgnify:CR=1 FL=1